MRSTIQAFVVGLILVLCGGLVINFVVQMRESSNRTTCTNNLHQIGITVANYQDSIQGLYPRAAMMNEDLPPERRLSWLVDIMPYLEDDPTYSQMDKKKAWDAEENRFAALCEFKRFHCAGYPDRPPESTLWSSHYIGLAGVGSDAATLPAGHPRAGVFGFDRELHNRDLTRGQSQTALLTETSAAQGGWTAGGPPTVRGFDPATSQFGGNHRGGCLVGFADGSVRLMNRNMSVSEWKRLVVLKDEPIQE
jgi:hypothetical protein